VLELGLSAARATGVLGRVVGGRDDYPVLRREAGPGELTVIHLLNARDETDYDRRAYDWGHAVWQAWTTHHAVIAAAVTELGQF
jgi:hypothetical protein